MPEDEANKPLLEELKTREGRKIHLQLDHNASFCLAGCILAAAEHPQYGAAFRQPSVQGPFADLLRSIRDSLSEPGCPIYDTLTQRLANLPAMIGD